MEYILGTVQLGMEYGIGNKTGKPDCEQSQRILHTAYKKGIRMLDTASAYVDAQQIIGHYQLEHGKKFRIGTKVMSNPSLYMVQQSLDALACDQIELLYLHRFQWPMEKECIHSITCLKEKGYIKKAGISIYEPWELEAILRAPGVVDVVQIPCSILSINKWMENELLLRAKNAGLTIYARSIFLQGLLMMEVDNPILTEFNATYYIQTIEQLSQQANKSRIQYIYHFMNSIPWIDGILFGCETEQQLLENINAIHAIKELEPLRIDNVLTLFPCVPEHIIDPRKWGR